MPYWGLVVTSDRVREKPQEDRVTPLVQEALRRAGEALVYRSIVGNNPVDILYAVLSALEAGADIVLVTGGTGPGPRDISADLVARLADRELPGVGEEFRRRSLEKGVKHALLSRAAAYTFTDRLIVVSPGNPDAVSTMLSILLPVAQHLVDQLRGKKHQPPRGQV